MLREYMRKFWLCSYFLSVLWLFYACSTLREKSASPAWTQSEQRSKLYPNTNYVQGFAQGQLVEGGNLENLMERLTSIARKELTESIQVQISQTGTLLSKEENNSVQSSYILQAHTKSDFDISNIQVLKYYQASTRNAFVFAYANREDLIRFYSQGLDAIFENAENYLNRGKQRVQHEYTPKQVRLALQDYAKAIQIIDSVDKKIKLLNSLGNKLWVGLYKDLLTRINNSVARVLDNFSINIRVQELEKSQVTPTSANSIGEFWQISNRVIKAQVLGANSLPIADVPVIFSLEGETIQQGISDAQGLVTCEPTLIRSAKPTQYLQIKIDLEQYLNASKSTIAKPVFKALNTKTKQVWKISPAKIYLEKSVQNLQLYALLQAFFSKHNFYIVDNREEASFHTQVDFQDFGHSQRNGIYFAYVNLSLKIYKNSNKEAIFAKECANIKGVGISQDQAVINAVQVAYNNLEQSLSSFVGY